MDKLDRELKRINDFNKIPANQSNPNTNDEFTANQKQSQRLSFRVTKDSHSLIKDMARKRNVSMADMSKSIMRIGLQKNFTNSYRLSVTNDIKNKLSELVYQSQSIGNNVNQISRSNHSFDKNVSLLDLSEDTVIQHDRMNKNIKSLSNSINILGKEVNSLCQQLQK